MEANMYVEAAGKALQWILILSLPPLIVSLVVGLALSLLQALTQIQEQTLTFVPKIIATVLAILASAYWMLGHLETFGKDIFALIPKVGLGK